MWNIIKALNYQTRRDIITCIAFIIGLLVQCLALLDYPDISLMKGQDFILTGSEIWIMAVGYMTVTVTCRICGWDFGDKTINYEILSGHNKAEIFFSRVLTTLIWDIGMTIAVTALPIAVITAINGWGNTLDFGALMIRYLLMLLPLTRFICFMIFLCFVIRNFAGSAVFSFIFLEGGFMGKSILDELGTVSSRHSLAIFNLHELLKFNSFYGMINGKDVMVYDASVEPAFAVKTVVISLAVSLVYLLAGYGYFNKKDLN